jgi:ssDNA-binding Zn-finger/Zn-ribbon topoisomerase 1
MKNLIKCTGCNRKLLKSKGFHTCSNCVKKAVVEVKKNREKNKVKMDLWLSCDQCILLLMINKNDYSFNWMKHFNDIDFLITNGYLEWESCTMAKITPKGYERINKMIHAE